MSAIDSVANMIKEAMLVALPKTFVRNYYGETIIKEFSSLQSYVKENNINKKIFRKLKDSQWNHTNT